MSERDLTQEIASVVEGLGFSLVECKAQGVKGTLHIHVVVHRPGGITADDCVDIHRTIAPRAELISGNRDINVEVSSPGIDRKLKSRREYPLFVGMPIRVLTLDDKWLRGTLEDADSEGITLKTDNDATERLAYPEIRSARLDDA